jgi:16S rRNA pseudouridine516 synthase
MRLDRLLANSGYGSRTAVKELIRKGKVTVAGCIVTDGGYKVEDILQNTIRIEEVHARVRKYLHFLLNKPSGVITALDDAKHRTVAEFIPAPLATAGLFPVGRLDIDTTGLLLLTNDGTLCHRLASPKWHVDKVYYFEVTGKYLDGEDRERLAKGLALADGLQCKPAILDILTPYSGLLTIQEGKYHQVKRMMKALGGTVTVLERRVMGPVVLDPSLSPGMIRELTEMEINALYAAVGLDPEMVRE